VRASIERQSGHRGHRQGVAGARAIASQALMEADDRAAASQPALPP